MVTWAEVSQWKADGIGQIGDHLAAQNRQVLGLQDEIDGAKPAGWAGEAADAAAGNLRARCQELEDLAARLSAAVKIIDDTEQAVRDLVRSVETTEDFAAKNGFRIDNGKVVETENAAWVSLHHASAGRGGGHPRPRRPDRHRTEFGAQAHHGRRNR